MTRCIITNGWKKICLLLALGMTLTFCAGYCADLTIDLSFVQSGVPKRFTPPKPKAVAVTVKGNVTLDIAPYPVTEKGRYRVEYFLNDQKLCETTGSGDTAPDTLSFKYLFDTTRYPNGDYKLIVNFWDKKGNQAIGIKDIVIKNGVITP